MDIKFIPCEKRDTSLMELIMVEGSKSIPSSIMVGRYKLKDKYPKISLPNSKLIK